MNAARTARTLNLPLLLALAVALAGCATPEETGANETDDAGMDGTDTSGTTGDGTDADDNATDEPGPSEDTTDPPPLGDDTIGSTDCPPSAYAGNITANETAEDDEPPVGDADVCPPGSTPDEA